KKKLVVFLGVPPHKPPPPLWVKLAFFIHLV
ncbi:MAG: hypothetical protein ACI8V8_002183, partial [Chitinophagales bacterium]